MFKNGFGGFSWFKSIETGDHENVNLVAVVRFHIPETKQPPTKTRTPPTLHAVIGGKALCGVLGDTIPAHWPSEHQWADDPANLNEITCPTCLARAFARLAEERSMPRISPPQSNVNPA